MERTLLKSAIVASLRSSDQRTLSEEAIRERVSATDDPVSLDEIKDACVSLVIEGRVDFLRAGSSRQYLLAPDEPS